MSTNGLKFLVLSSLLLCAVWAPAEMREFKLLDGRSLKAEIIGFNSRLGQVELKREDGKRVKVKPSIFVAEDQSYIKEWDALKAFSSPRFLKILCDDKKIDERKEEEYKNISDTEGNVERTLMKITAFEKIAYELIFQNMNQTALDGLRMDYVIYYEQSIESYEKPEIKQKYLAAKMDIPSLPGKKKTEVLTKPVEIHKDNINSINWVSGRARVGGEGEVHGFRARIYMKTASGKEVMREFCYPSSLSTKNFPWKSGTSGSSKSGKKGNRNKKG